MWLRHKRFWISNCKQRFIRIELKFLCNPGISFEYVEVYFYLYSSNRDMECIKAICQRVVQQNSVTYAFASSSSAYEARAGSTALSLLPARSSRPLCHAMHHYNPASSNLIQHASLCTIRATSATSLLYHAVNQQMRLSDHCSMMQGSCSVNISKLSLW